jgi:hypothetical protein
MYIVRDKSTKAVIHINPAPLSQHLEAEEIYFQWNPDRMEVIRTDAPELPEHFSVVNGQIVEATLQDLVKQGIVVLRPEEKVENNQIVPKPLSEQIAEGLLSLPPTHKLVVTGDTEAIVEKTLSEQVAEGIVVLNPTEQIVGEGDDERIDTRLAAAAVPEEPGELAANQKLANGDIVKKTLREQFEEGLLTLEQAKQARLEHFSTEAIAQRRHILPDYKLLNAGLGIYDEQTVAGYKATVQAYRDEFHRLEALIEQTDSLDEIESVTARFPATLVT